MFEDVFPEQFYEHILDAIISEPSLINVSWQNKWKMIYKLLVCSKNCFIP